MSPPGQIPECSERDAKETPEFQHLLELGTRNLGLMLRVEDLCFWFTAKVHGSMPADDHNTDDDVDDDDDDGGLQSKP